MCNAPCTTPECVCTTQEECKCEQEDKGYWFADAAKPTCICKGLLGDKFNECVCTKGPKKGVWINGDCDRKGSGGLPTYDDDGAGGGLGSTAGNDSTDSGTELSVSSGGSGLSGLGDVGGASKAAGSSAGYGSGKSWIAQLKDTFGVSSTAGGQKPGASSKGGSFGVGTGGAPTKSKGATHGIADSKSDLFAMVTTTYNTQYTSGKIMDQPSGATSTKPVKKLGSQPISY